MNLSRAIGAPNRYSRLYSLCSRRSSISATKPPLSARAYSISKSSSPSAWVPTPMIVETVAGGYHSYDIYSKLLKERIILLNGQVTDEVSAAVVAQLLFLEADNPEKPIQLYIQSPGGSVTAGLAIYDTMQYINCEVSTIGMGQCASMGSLLLAGGHPGKRFALDHTSVMLHQPQGGHSGQASDIAIYAKEILRVREQLLRIYHKHLQGAGKEKQMSELETLLDRDYFMDSAQARELGVIDEILVSRSPK